MGSAFSMCDSPPAARLKPRLSSRALAADLTGAVHPTSDGPTCSRLRRGSAPPCGQLHALLVTLGGPPSRRLLFNIPGTALDELLILTFVIH
eukprot:4077052-Prymnesium_polylepis.1